MLEVQQLSFDYCDEPILNEVSFTVSPGALLYLRGANGAGKTTLLKLIAGLFLPLNGQVVYEGRLIYDDLQGYQKQLCLVSHAFGMSPFLTVDENLRFDLKNHQRSSTLEPLLDSMGLTSRRYQLCGQLSAGQKKKVSLLRLFLNDVPLWLLDEPFVSLDTQTTDFLIPEIIKHRDRGGMILLTSHQPLPCGLRDYQEYQL